MNRNLYIALIALGWFASAWFAVAALDPASALPAAWLAVIVGLLFYLWLDFRGQVDTPGLPLALALLAPVICATAGVVWWFLRLVGLWKPFR